MHKAPFGASFIYWKPSYKPEGFNSWVHSQLGRTMVALYQGTGDQRVLNALGESVCRLPGEHGADPFPRRQRPVQSGGHAGAFEPAAVFQPRHLPYSSVLYGPLLFALPIPDVDPNTPAKDAKWQYALDTEASHRAGGIQVVTGDARTLGLAVGRPLGIDRAGRLSIGNRPMPRHCPTSR